MDFSKLLDLIFPAVCVHCGTGLGAKEVICGRCAELIQTNQTLFCGHCRARLPSGKRICHPGFPYFLGAAGSYKNDALRSLIHALKFQLVRGAAETLGELLAGYAAAIRFPWNTFLVVPVPLSERRKRERGFNQAALIAQSFAKRLGLPYHGDFLVRVKHSRPQSELGDRAERLQNVSGCFAVTDASRLIGKNLILVDDVTTSGATFEEAARALKAVKVRRIVAIAVAKS